MKKTLYTIGSVICFTAMFCTTDNITIWSLLPLAGAFGLYLLTRENEKTKAID